MCSGALGKVTDAIGLSPKTPKVAAVDAEAEAEKAAQEAAAETNAALVSNAKRKRKQKGLLSEDAGASVLSTGASTSSANTGSTVLGSGGAA